MVSAVSQLLPCDGCGQLADSQHIALRLQRLEWATRFRPVHIQALLLSGISPPRDDEFLYNLDGKFEGESRVILDAVGISSEGNNSESILSEFQKRGLMLIHVLECPLLASSSPSQLLEKQLAATVTRIRRSLKPKRVMLVSADLPRVAEKLRQADLGCPVYPQAGGVLLSGTAPRDAELQAFRQVLGASHAQTA